MDEDYAEKHDENYYENVMTIGIKNIIRTMIFFCFDNYDKTND